MKGLTILCALIGLALPTRFSSLPDSNVLLALFLASVILFFVKRSRPIAFLCLGVLVSSLNLQSAVSKQLPEALEGTDLSARIVVKGLPEVSSLSTRFLAEIVFYHDAAIQWNEPIRLSWYEAPTLMPGEVFDLEIRLKRPRGMVNEHGFDYQAWLLARKIYATGYVRKKLSKESFQEVSGLSVRLARIRAHLTEKLFSSDSLQYPELSRALLLGDKSSIQAQQWARLQLTGTLHLMAISGLHVGLLAALGFLLGRFLARLLACIGLSRYSLNFIAPALSIVLSVTYAAIAGFSIPTQRAALFVLLVNTVFVLGRRTNYFYLLGLCAIIIGVFDPFAFVSPGFYLSFLAVLILFYCFLGREEGNRQGKMSAWFFGSLKAQLILSVALIVPLTILGLPISSISFLANFIAIPVISFVVVPLLFAAAVVSILPGSFAALLIALADRSLQMLWHYLGWLESFEMSSLHFPVPDLQTSLLGSLAIVLLLSPAALKFRFIGAFLLCVFLWPQGKRADVWTLTTLDVGQGLAIHIQGPEIDIVYDTGARFSENFDMGSRVVAPYLFAKGVQQLDYLIVSHGDNDHAGGLAGLLRYIAVDNLVLGESVAAAGFERAAGCHTLRPIATPGLKWTVLWPLEGPGKMDRFSGSNNASCVISLEINGSKILLTGDIEKGVERELLRLGVLPKDIDVLVAPHHGSRSSSSKNFIESLNPAIIIVSSGYNNRYGHPHEAVLERYRAVDARVMRTDREGAVSLNFRANCFRGEACIDISAQRQVNTRVWF